jgi:Family of unknown function (DUF6263)
MCQGFWLGVVLVVGAPTAPATGQIKIEWKLKEGDKFYLEERSNLKQTMKFMGSDLKQELDHTRLTLFTVLKKTDESLVLEQKIESVKINRASGSAKPEGKLLQELEGATFKVYFNSKMKVIKLDGYDNLIKKMAKNEEIGKNARLLLPEESLSRPVEAFFTFLPDKAVAKGDKWAHEFSLPLGPLGTLKQENGYTVLGTDRVEGKEVVKLEVVNKKSSFTPAAGGGAQPFRVAKGDIRVNAKKTRGTVYFSASLGRLVKSVKTMHVEGTLTIDVKGNMLTMDLEQEDTVTARILDKKP